MNTTLQRGLAGVWVLSVSIGICRADDWPQWLGPQRDSVWRETGIVEQFPAGGPAVKWRAPVAGGYAGPAVADGRVYVTDYASSGDRTPDPNSRSKLQGQERVWCLSAADGRVLWKHEYDCAYEISFPAGPRATPTVDGDRVYTLGAQGDLFCLKTADGSVVWSRNFQRDYQATTPIWGYCGHPLVDGGKLFCVVGGADSIAVAFDKQTGKELWRALSAKEQALLPADHDRIRRQAATGDLACRSDQRSGSSDGTASTGPFPLMRTTRWGSPLRGSWGSTCLPAGL